ncbi:MAG: flagellar hook-associated protein FlgK [Agathobacter sp.]|nr:flagellar hook-associated protein FlgK [Agathobacter sp.]
MSSTFFGLNIGKNALNAFQVGINTTANNISNVKTKGYSRQYASMRASNPLRVTARYGSTGTGVEVTAIKQERNLYYDTKYRENESNRGYFDQKLYYLDQIQTVFADDSIQTGFSSIFTKMFSSMDTLISNGPADLNARNQFLNAGQNLCTYFKSLSENLKNIQEDCNEEIRTTVDQINAISKKLSLLNKEINQIETGTGAYASELRDERANLLDELSALVNVETEEYPIKNSNYDNDLGGTIFRVVINGQLLVDNGDARTIEYVSQETKSNLTDIDGLYKLIWSDTKDDFAANTGTAGGTLKALFSIRDGDHCDNLKGTVHMTDDHQAITVTNLSITDLKALNLADYDGTVKVCNKVLRYDSWEANLDEEGNIESITFNLNQEVSDVFANQIEGAMLESGSAVDAMGVPYYQAQINQFVRTFAMLFNDIETTGMNLNGETAPEVFVALNASGDMFDFLEWKEDADDRIVSSMEGSYYRMTASNVSINPDMLRDPRLMATATSIIDGVGAYDIITKLKTLEKDVNMFRGDNAGKFLETLISDVSVDTEKADIYCKNYTNLESIIGNQRTSVSGVDEDEEGLNLIRFQNAYNMASKLISVMSEIYDKLINETGV